MKRQKIFVSLVLICLLLPALGFQIPNVSASPGWLTGWTYRKPHVIKAATGAGTNYQVCIKTYFGEGTDGTELVNAILSGAIYLENNSRTDFGDIRFTDDDETTELDYWQEEYVSSDYSVFWVEVADSLSSSNVLIWVYYGKSDATTTSNGVETFRVFDHFDDESFNTTLWDSWGRGGDTHVETGTELTINTDAAMGYEVHLASNIKYSVGCAVETRLKSTGTVDAKNRAGMQTDTGFHYDYWRTMGYRYLGQGAVNFSYQSSNNVVWSEYDYDLLKDQEYHRSSTKRSGTTYARLAIDDIEMVGDYFTNVDRKIYFRAENMFSGVASLVIDWVLLRNYVTPEPEPGIANIDVTISNMEGCGDWVFAEERYYDFEARVLTSFTLDTIKIAFTDGANWVNATWDSVEDIYSLDSGSDVAILQAGSNSTSAQITTVIFPIYFQNTILDTLNVDIYLYANATNGEECAWALGATDYFSIYNLGGEFSLADPYTWAGGSDNPYNPYYEGENPFGHSGRTEGGQLLEIYAGTDGGHVNNISYVRYEQTWRNLQSVHMLVSLDPRYNNTYGDVNPDNNRYNNIGFWLFGIDYCINDTWVSGFYASMTMVSCGVHATNPWTDINYWNMSVLWATYWSGSEDQIRNDHILAFNEVDGPYARFWVDLWFDVENSSTVVAGRVNSYYHAFWTNLIGQSGRILGKEVSPFATTLRDINGEATSASQIEMMKFWYEIYQVNLTWANLHRIVKVEAINYQFAPDVMQGIDEPILVETKDPAVGYQWGFFEPLRQALMALGAMIVEALGPALLSFWNIFVAFLDTIFTWIGYPGAFSQFIAVLTSAWEWFITSLGYVVDLLVQSFLFLASGMEKFISLVITATTNFILVIQGVWNMLDSGWGMTASLWDTLQLETWIIIGCILYPIHLVFLWDEQGLGVVINEITFLVGIIAFLIKGFLTTIDFFINLIFGIIEKIPVAE